MRISPARLCAQAGEGGKAEVIGLADLGLKGNSRMVMMGKNSDEVAALIQKWLVSQGLAEN